VLQRGSPWWAALVLFEGEHNVLTNQTVTASLTSQIIISWLLASISCAGICRRCCDA
jgi:hypothetical protein